MTIKEYDGFYFLPGDDECELNLAYFMVKEGGLFGTPVGGNSLGDMYHIAFFKSDEEGQPQFDEEFEAIFADPSVYIKSLIGANIYGCILRKTDKSLDWWTEYLEKAKEYCQLLKLKHIIKDLTQLKDAKEESVL